MISGDHAKKEMETGDKPTTTHGKASSEESCNKGKGKGKEKKSSSHKSHRSGDKKKKMRKVVYYETDTYALSQTVRAGAADGPRPDDLRQSARLLGLSIA